MRSLQRIQAPAVPGEIKLPWETFDLKGKNLQGMLTEIEKRNLDPGQLIKLFGRQEALDAYRILRGNAPRYEEALGTIRRGEREDEVAKRLAFHREVPGLVAAKEAEEATAQESLSRGGLGIRANLAQAAMAEQQAAMRKAGMPETVTWATDILEKLERWGLGWVGGDETYLRERRYRGRSVQPPVWERMRLRPSGPAAGPSGMEIPGLPEVMAPPPEPIGNLRGTAPAAAGSSTDVLDAVRDSLERNAKALDRNSQLLESNVKKKAVGAAGLTGVHSE